ncbi:uncharacterized protein LOC110822771 [Carica papaya]|uniref:uncharacterized protein LOC110822771 n=1 Tax=Carica papaya TaxID=3649 RepID=UPI000B8C906D|nr:uncharacterized protein LOC110822771 [Carica papaya]
MAEEEVTPLTLDGEIVSAAADQDRDNCDETTTDRLSIPPLEKLKFQPRKKLLVLGLGGVLTHRIFHTETVKIPKSRSPTGRYGNHLVYKRAFCDEFLSFCFERFELGIWSSATRRNSDSVLDCILRDLRGKLLFLWDEDHCTDSGFKSLESKGKALRFKQLKKLWENLNQKFPDKLEGYSASNTLLIDDRPYKALLNPPNTSIFPELYLAKNVNDKVLDPKGELGLFLEGLAMADDVQSYVRTHAYGQPPIVPSHPDWFYYSMVVDRISQRMSSLKI